jgi:enoyl-CoA hydratase
LTGEVLFAARRGLGHIRLNRPKALHALTAEMCAAIDARLQAWANDPAIVAVMIDHAGGRGFCAGGDVRKVAAGAKDGAPERFFAAEYAMNARIQAYPKPYLAVIDGITMGGGAGLSVHGRYRLATERTVFAMPETGLGLFPDVGGGWFLPRLPGKTGAWLALTGARLTGADCFALGLATHYVRSENLPPVKAALAADPARVQAILDAAHEDPGAAPVSAHREAIDRLFASSRAEEIFAALEADGGDWADQQLAVLRTKSPQTIKLTLRLLAQNAPSFVENMRMEYRIAVRVVRAHDFAEGVRAVLIDKDNTPHWSPATLEDVSDGAIEAFFAPLPPEQELKLIA